MGNVMKTTPLMNHSQTRVGVVSCGIATHKTVYVFKNKRYDYSPMGYLSIGNHLYIIYSMRCCPISILSCVNDDAH